MKCDEVQLMLPDFVVNKISNGQVSKIQSHIDSCPDCKHTAAELQELMFGLRELPQEEPSDRYFATILPRIHERIDSQKKGFTVPDYVMRFLMPAAMIVIVTVGIMNYNKFFPYAPVPATTANAITTESSADDLTAILGQQELDTYDKITETDKELISELITSETAALQITEDDAKSLLLALNEEDVNEFYALLEQTPDRN